MERPTYRELLKDAVIDMGGKAKNKEIVDWIFHKFPDANKNTIQAQIIACSVNRKSRIHYPENQQEKQNPGNYDVLFSIGPGEVELYDPQKHGRWGIMNHEGEFTITHEGKPIINSDSEYFFVEKDFQSLTGKKEDSQYIYARFKTLHEILKKNLSSNFNNFESYVSRPFNQGSKKWNNYEWIGFARKGTFLESKYDSVQFQVSLNKNDDISIMVWVDVSAKNAKNFASQQIKQNKDEFLKILKNLPNSFYVGILTVDTEIKFEHNVSKIDLDKIDNIADILLNKKSEFYVKRYVRQNEAIEIGETIVDEISTTFEKLIPVESFLGMEILESDLTFKEAAIKVLEDAQKPLHYKEITAKAIEKKFIISKGKTPELSLLRDITEDIRIHKENSIFKRKSEGVYYVGEFKQNYFLAMGPWSNWDHSLSKKPIIWGVKPDTSNTNIGVFNQLELGDIVFLYVSRHSPSKFSTYGIFGIGKITRKCSNEKIPYWPDEIQENKVVYTHRFEIEPIKIIENDDDLLWFDGLPNVKGLNVIKSENPGLEPLLDAVKNEWNVNFGSEKYFMIQNEPKYPVLRKAEIDKIFDINYARGITDYGRNDYVVVISSLAGIFEDQIDDEFISYIGEGQKERGDQTLTGGNLAIVEAKNKGRKLYFLHELKNPKGGRTNDYEFLGEVECVKHDVKYEPSENRNIIRFKLKRIHSPWNIQENNTFTGFDFSHENIHELPNNSKLISFQKIDDDIYFKAYGYVGNFEQEQCTAPLRNLFLPITSKISPFCSDPTLEIDEIELKEKLEKIIRDATYDLSGQKSIVLISILYWLSKNKFNESSLVDYLKSLNVKSDGTSITELELLVNNSKLFSDYVLIYKLYQSLGLMKFEIIDRIGYHIKQSLEMNNNSDRLISDFSKYEIDSELSKIEPNRAKVLLYSLLRDHLEESILIDFWNGLYGQYHTIKCSPEILEKIKNQPNFDPESQVIEIKPEIYTSLMSQFSEISQTKEVSDGKLRIPTKNEVKKGIKEIQKELLINDSIIEEIVTHLASGRHVLLAGPVGTGKTRISQLISQVFWTDNCGYFADVRTATADWNTQDVIGGISPKIQEGSRVPTYEIENGCVTDTILANYERDSRLSERPQRHTSIHTVDSKKRQFNGTWLVIDEFNRADIDKAFGQLFTALEYNKLIIQDITSGKSTRTIPIPKDYRIIGTLNTADKHYLFNLSDALKRRFAYVEISIPERNEKNKQREIYLAIKNGLKDLDSEKFDNIIKINSTSNTLEYHSDKIQRNIESGYNILEVVREFKPLGTAILKAIYQTLLVSEIMENKDSFDNAINANLTPQLETLPKPSLEILHAYLFGSIVEFIETENHREQYKSGLESLLRYLNFTSDDIKVALTEFVNGQIPNLLSGRIEEMKKSNNIAFPNNSLFKKSLEEIIKQSEF